MRNSCLSGLLLTLLLPLQSMAADVLPSEPAKRVSVPREVRLDSRVEAVQQATVSAQTGGQIEEILFDVGDYVEKGQLLVRLRDTEQRARQTRAEAALDEARAGLKKVGDEHRRISDLFARKLVSTAEMDQARSALEASEARVNAARADRHQAGEQLEYTQVRAPYSGIVIQRHAEVGEVAQPGKPLITGISLDRLRTLVALPQSLMPTVRATAKAHVLLPDNERIEATRVTVYPIADHPSNTFLVRVDLPAGSTGLFPGMFVKTVFQLGEQQWLTIPGKSLAHRGEVTGVYVLDEQAHLSFRHIRAGRQLDDGRIAVLAGLQAGERVALDPVAAGVALKAQQREAANVN
jgi:RND family efflux transporter MFP subunit